MAHSPGSRAENSLHRILLIPGANPSGTVDRRLPGGYNRDVEKRKHPVVCVTPMLLPTYHQKDSGSVRSCQASVLQWKTISGRRSPPCREAGDKAKVSGIYGILSGSPARTSFFMRKKGGLLSWAGLRAIGKFTGPLPGRSRNPWCCRTSAPAHPPTHCS